jgi:steroid delta-isomerase-like uncharacterized protein
MSVETTREVMARYFGPEGLDFGVLADDVVYTFMPDGQETQGPEAVEQMINHMYRVAFAATPETRTVLISDGHAAYEGEFVGKHIGEFAGIPATGKDVRVPQCVFYDIEGERIKRARVYFEVPVLLRQLGVQM